MIQQQLRSVKRMAHDSWSTPTCHSHRCHTHTVPPYRGQSLNLHILYITTRKAALLQGHTYIHTHTAHTQTDTHTHTHTSAHIILSGGQLHPGLSHSFRNSLANGVRVHVLHPIPSLPEPSLLCWITTEKVVMSHLKLRRLREHLTGKEKHANQSCSTHSRDDMAECRGRRRVEGKPENSLAKSVVTMA